jgi:AcrR family transcriptional regulator
MRQLILNTTLDCLAEQPAAQVSVAAIAERAGVSRGGMQYHFRTRVALLAAAAEHVHERRLRQFQEDLAAMPDDRELVDHIVETHWRHLNERDFRAYQELVLAARSDAALSALLAPRYRDFLQTWYEIAQSSFGWRYTAPEVARAGNVAHYILEGMAYGQLAGQLSQTDIQDLLEYAKTVLREALALNGSPQESKPTKEATSATGRRRETT